MKWCASNQGVTILIPVNSAYTPRFPGYNTPAQRISTVSSFIIC